MGGVQVLVLWVSMCRLSSCSVYKWIQVGLVYKRVGIYKPIACNLPAKSCM